MFDFQNENWNKNVVNIHMEVGSTNEKMYIKHWRLGKHVLAQGNRFSLFIIKIGKFIVRKWKLK